MVCRRGRAAVGSAAAAAGALQQPGSRGSAAAERGWRGAGMPLPFSHPVPPFEGMEAEILPSRSFESLPEPDEVTAIVPKPRRSAS